MRTLYPGQGFTAATDFDNPIDEPPHFEIVRASDNALVTEGLAQQDSVLPQRWFSPVVLPDTVTPGEYSIIWIARHATIEYKNTEAITIGYPRTDFVEIDRLFREDEPISDLLLVDHPDDTLTNISAKVLTANGNEQFTSSTSTQETRDGESFYRIDFGQGLKAGTGAFSSYIVQWDFILNGTPTTEYHFFYVANYTVLAYVNELRRMIDKAHLQHKNPALRWNDVDLVAFLNLGLQYVNSSKPTLTAYGFSSIPNVLFTYVLAAAAMEALDSRYLAEAEAAFNFTGQPISLDVDRTGYLESAREHYKEKLDNLPSVKKSIILSTGGNSGGMGVGSSAGVLVLSNSVSLDWGGSLGLTSLSFRPGSRAIFYDTLLANL